MILRRQITSIKNLLAHLHLIDDLVVIDNSQASGEIVMQIEKFVLTYQVDALPNWVLPIIGYMEK